MVWVIIIVVLALIISPAMWLRPSPQQQRVARLRDVAIKAGVRVRLETPPLHDHGGLLPGYHWPYPPQYPGPRFVLVKEEEASEALKAFMPGWRWRIEPLRPLPGGAVARLETLLNRLPEDALIVESGREALTLWWRESLDAEGFATDQEDFDYLRHRLAGRPDEPLPRRLGFGGKPRDGEGR